MSESKHNPTALLAATLGELCQGQVAEVRAAFRVDRSRDDYSGAIAGKTASLMATRNGTSGRCCSS